MTLYNLKSADGQYRITKFTNDLDVESSYLLSETECECPAGSRPSCRHRQMLPTMLAEELCDSGGFYDFDNKQVLVPAYSIDEAQEIMGLNSETEIIADDFEGMPNGVEKDYQREVPLTGLQEEQILMRFHNPTATEIANRPLPKLPGEPLIEYMVNQTFNALPHPSIGPIKRRI